MGIPEPGRIVGGKYRIGALIGTGGMAAIVSAEHLELGTGVAIKILLPELARDSEWTARLRREARVIAAIKSERVAKVFDVGRLDNGTPYIVMERLEGTNLDQEVRDHGTMSTEDGVDIVLEVCEALAEAHRLGVVHRDLKPSNLFVARRADGSRLIKVLDFGISKALLSDKLSSSISSLTRTQSVLGSPQYMSPEQIRSSKNVDHRTDIWALGVILHKLVTGRLPFEAETVAAYLAKVAADAPTPVSSHKSDLPARLEQIVLRCLEKDPQRRYANVGQLARALLPFASGVGLPSARRAMELCEVDPNESEPEGVANPERDGAGVPADPAPPAPETRKRQLAWALILALGVAIVAMAFRSSTRSDPPSSVPASPDPTFEANPAVASGVAKVAPPATILPPTSIEPLSDKKTLHAGPRKTRAQAAPSATPPEPVSTQPPATPTAAPKLKGPMEAEL